MKASINTRIIDRMTCAMVVEIMKPTQYDRPGQKKKKLYILSMFSNDELTFILSVPILLSPSSSALL